MPSSGRTCESSWLFTVASGRWWPPSLPSRLPSGRIVPSRTSCETRGFFVPKLAALVKIGLKRMQYRPGLIVGFLAKIGLDLTPFSNLCN